MEQAVLQKWDYRVEEFNSVREMQATLSRLGGEGWELVNVTGGASGDSPAPVKTLRRKQDTFHAFLKRPDN